MERKLVFLGKSYQRVFFCLLYCQWSITASGDSANTRPAGVAPGIYGVYCRQATKHARETPILALKGYTSPEVKTGVKVTLTKRTSTKISIKNSFKVCKLCEHWKWLELQMKSNKIERELSILKSQATDVIVSSSQQYINHKIDTKVPRWSDWLNCNQKGARWFYLYHEIGQAQPAHVNIHLWPVEPHIVSWPLQRPDTGSSACNMAPVLSRSIILFVSAYWTDILGYSSYITVEMIFLPQVKLLKSTRFINLWDLFQFY